MTTHSSHADEVVGTARRIVEDAMLARDEHSRRLSRYRRPESVVAELTHTARKFGLVPDAPPKAAARPLPPLDEDAFAEAERVFETAYRRAWDSVPPFDRVEQAHHEATNEALQAFLATYMELTR